VAGSKSATEIPLRVPSRDQQIKGGSYLPGFSFGGVRVPALHIDLKSRPLGVALRQIFAGSWIGEIRENYHQAWSQNPPHPYFRQPADAEISGQSLDTLITEGYLAHPYVAALLMQLALERAGVYSEIVIGMDGPNIAVYQPRAYRGTPGYYPLDATSMGPFREAQVQWLERPSKRGK
jgi:hypothetical protein